MIGFVLKRCLQALLTLLGVATVAFALSTLGGDPATLLSSADSTDAEIAAIRTAYGLDRPLIERYTDFMVSAAQGDFGNSLMMNVSATQLVLDRLPATIELAVTAFVLGIGLAFVLGLAIQITQSRLLKGAALTLAFTRQAIPVFWFGLLMMMLFSVHLQWLPTMGRGTLAHLVLPAITLASYELGLYLRLINAGFASEERQEYVRTALAKGQTRTKIVLRHMLPNALLPLITVAGLNLGHLLGGTVVAEVVFSWPGVGRLLIQAVSQRDFPVIMACVVLMAAIFVLMNLIVDLVYALVDPRVRMK
ncbi:MAG: ABC transporter permease [Gemmobacter sp.]|nr:ABC transporter permease [Gemmobacter sp.]